LIAPKVTGDDFNRVGTFFRVTVAEKLPFASASTGWLSTEITISGAVHPRTCTEDSWTPISSLGVTVSKKKFAGASFGAGVTRPRGGGEAAGARAAASVAVGDGKDARVAA
jgi:hypothetical protein